MTQRQDAVSVTTAALLSRLDRYLPDETYRDYYAWALSGDNPDREVFSRIIALTQLGNLTTVILTGLGGPGDFPTLVRHAVPVNLYQIFEVVSDNLGLGLATVRPWDRSHLRDLLLGFNAVAADDLRQPSSRPAADLLAHLKEPSERVSSFDQSLAAPSHASIVGRYGVDLEHTVWSGLVANIESGRDVLAAIDGTDGEPQVRSKTVERYEAVDRTLTTPWLSRDELVLTSTQTVLVAPTLGYFAVVFGEILGTDPGYPAVLADGSLMAAFDTASLLVRLQNDVGTTLLRMFPHERAALLRKLALAHAIPEPDTAIALLTMAVSDPALNRFRKDLVNGEFNICLYDVHRTKGLADGLAVFSDNLDYFADLYARQSALLADQLAALDQKLHDRRITEVTRRFVRFHETLYTHRYDDLSGDYAI